MLRQLGANNHGIVFVTVLMIIIAMMIATVSIISLNVTQAVNTEAEVRRIQAEYLALGAVPYFYANQMTSSSSNTMIYTQSLDGIPFMVVANITGPGFGGYNTNALGIVVTY